MKTVVIKISKPAPGDLVIVDGCSPRGGKTGSKHLILGERLRPILEEGVVVKVEKLPPETALEIATDLANQINGGWLPDLAQAKVKPDGSLIINCSDLCDYIFSTEVGGKGGTAISLTEL